MVFVIPGPKRAVTAASPPSDQGLGDLGLELPDLPSGQPDLGSDFGNLLDEALSEPLPAVSRPADSSAAERTVASPKRRRSTRAQMGVLANGIKLVFWGTLMGLIAVLLTVIARFIPSVALVTVLIMLLGGILATIGRMICLGAPSQVGGKEMLIGAVICDLASIGLVLANSVGASVPFAPLIANGLWLGTFILFVLFLKAVATSIGQEHLVDSAQSVIMLTVVAIVSLVGVPLAALTFPLFMLAGMLVFVAATLMAVFKYLSLLQHTAECVRP
jgi:hypothetical protein